MHNMIGELTPETKALLQKVYGDTYDAFWNTPTAALRDAQGLAESGPYPVIFFSHGFMGLRFQNYSLCEHLASHGFVVVAVDHYGNSAFVNLPGEPLVMINLLETAASYFDRTEDVAFIYNELEKIKSDPGQPLGADLFDLERFAVSGHSFGGLTSMFCGLDFDFVDAIAPLNPAWAGAFPDGFSKPFFLLQGENDAFVKGMNESVQRHQEEATSTRKLYLNLIRGGHFNATDVCVLVPPSFTGLAQGCEPPEIDFRLANRISNAYMTAFFKSVLYGDDRYDSYIKDNHFPEEIELAVVWE